MKLYESTGFYEAKLGYFSCTGVLINGCIFLAYTRVTIRPLFPAHVLFLGPIPILMICDTLSKNATIAGIDARINNRE